MSGTRRAPAPGDAALAGTRRAPVDPRLARRVRAVRSWLALSVAIGLGLTASLVAQALLLADVLSRLMQRHAGLRPVALALVGIAAAGAARAALLALGSTAGARAASAVRGRLRHDGLAAVLARGPSWLAGERGGELAVTLGPGLDALDAYVGDYLPRLVLAALAPAVLLAVIAALDWLSLVVLLVAVALVPVFMVLVGRLTEARTARRWGALTRLGAHFLDAVEGLPTLRAYGRARRQEQQIAAVSDDLRRATLAVLRQAFLSSLVLETIAALSTALVAVPLALRLIDGRMALAPALAVLVLVPEVFLPLRRASADFHAAAGGLSAADRVFDILDGATPATAPDTANPARAARSGPRRAVVAGGSTPPGEAAAAPLGARRPGGRPASLSLSSVWVHRGDPPVPVLAGADLHVPAGGRVALVGASGSGKSTLCAALLGLAPLSGGRISVGGQRQDRCDPEAWRRLFAYVPQDPHLFAGTLRDNLLLAAPGAGPAQVDTAVVAAQLQDVVSSLPAGLDSDVGRRGERLSTGERQRVALARALLRREAPVVVLDEPSAHLDTGTEAAVVAALQELLAGRTLLVATHRRRLLDLVELTVAVTGGQLVPVPSGGPGPDPARHGPLDPVPRRPPGAVPAEPSP